LIAFFPLVDEGVHGGLIIHQRSPVIICLDFLIMGLVEFPHILVPNPDDHEEQHAYEELQLIVLLYFDFL
jgi:hypothetical protein